MFNRFRRRNSELDKHAETGRLQGIADNPSSRRQQNQNSFQYYDLPPVSTEHQATYDGDAIYNYPHYHPSHSGQPPNSIAGSPLHQQTAQQIGSTTWQSPYNIYSNYLSHSFSHYTSASGSGLPDVHLADTPPITYSQPFNHDIHYQIQAPGGLDFEHVANDGSKPYIPYPAGSSPVANIQPVHYNTRRPIQSPEGPYFGHLADDRFKPYVSHHADSHCTCTTHSLQHPSSDQSLGGPDFGGVVDHDGFTRYTPHPADPPRIAHMRPVRYDDRHQIQPTRWPHFRHITNDEFEPDVYPADSPPITSMQLVHHGIFRHQEGPYFGPGFNDESESDTRLADFTPLANTAHRQVRLAEVGPGVNESNSDDSPRPYTCMWQHNGYECGRIAAEGVAQHMTTFHLTGSETHYVCQWRDCRRSRRYRRDTICRHISEVHLGKRRRSS